ncbi:tyrosine-type recombinase/integrase [Peribacillus sp. NPDC097295]|uniref:tyrosine-type recombinase/integrase n=1 Tax=Peribacillus sp. NPDC097295 TaxID=3364402 RepID=UPI0038027CCE
MVKGIRNGYCPSTRLSCLCLTRKKHQCHPSQPVFLNKLGKPLDPRGLHAIFKNALRKSVLPPSRFSLHHLRHTFATLMLQGNKENVDLRTL